MLDRRFPSVPSASRRASLVGEWAKGGSQHGMPLKPQGPHARQTAWSWRIGAKRALHLLQDSKGPFARIIGRPISEIARVPERRDALVCGKGMWAEAARRMHEGSKMEVKAYTPGLASSFGLLLCLTV